MKQFVCTVCGYVYDEAAGDPDNGIAAGTAFADPVSYTHLTLPTICSV